MTKTCKVCNTDKEEHELVVAYTKEDGSKVYRSLCKSCANKIREEYRKKNKSKARVESNKKRHKEYRENNREYLQWKRLEREYNLTQEQYAEKLKEQGGGCAICGTTSNVGQKKLAVDHDHTTGQVRGILCHHCNTAIGSLREDPQLFSKAVTYLLNFKKDLVPTN